MKILIVKTSSLGDIIQGFSVLEELYARFEKLLPERRGGSTSRILRNDNSCLDAVLKDRDCGQVPVQELQIDWVVEESFADLVAAHPLVHRTILRRDWKGVRQERYDVLFDLQGNCKSGLVSLLARSHVKVGFGWRSVREWPNILATRVHINPSPHLNMRLQYLALVQGYFDQYLPRRPVGQFFRGNFLSSLYRNNLKNRNFGKEGPQNLHSERGTIAEKQDLSENANSEANPTQLKNDSSGCFGIVRYKFPIRFAMSVEEREQMTRWRLQGATLKVMVCPGSQWVNKQLRPDVWIGFLQGLQKQLSASFLIVGTDRFLCQQLTEAIPGSAFLEKPSFSLWQNLMSEMDLVLAVDSSALHFCGTTQTPSFSFFGPTSPQVFKPEGDRHGYYRGVCPYGQIFKKQCPQLRNCSTGACLRTVESAEILRNFMKWYSGLL